MCKIFFLQIKIFVEYYQWFKLKQQAVYLKAFV